MHMRLESIAAWNELEGLGREDLLSSVFRLTDTEAKTYFTLVEKSLNVQQLAERLGKDRSTSQKILRRLVSEGLAQRVRELHPNGGMKYIYQAADFRDVKSKMAAAAESWLKAFRSHVEKL